MYVSPSLQVIVAKTTASTHDTTRNCTTAEMEKKKQALSVHFGLSLLKTIRGKGDFPISGLFWWAKNPILRLIGQRFALLQDHCSRLSRSFLDCLDGVGFLLCNGIDLMRKKRS